MKLSKRQKSLLARAFKQLGFGVAECSQLVGQAMESDDAYDLLALRVEQIAKLLNDVNNGIQQSRAADVLIAKIEKNQQRPAPRLHLVKGGR